MKKYPALIFGAILICAFLAYAIFLFSTRPRLKSMLAFYAGEKLAKLRVDEHTGCGKIPSYYQVFCQEGYSESFFMNTDGPVETKTSEWKKKFSQPGQTELIGAGVGFAHFFSYSVDFEKYLLEKISMPNENLKFLMDGWAFSQMIYQGKDLKNALLECSKIESGMLKEVCWFGVGRSLYFLNHLEDESVKQSLIGQSPSLLVFFYKGHGFASSFAGRERPNKITLPDSAKGMAVAESVRAYYANRELTDPIQACLHKGEHFAFCN